MRFAPGCQTRLAEAARLLRSAASKPLGYIRRILSFLTPIVCFVMVFVAVLAFSSGLAQSTACAQQFSAPVSLNSTATTDTQDDGAPSLATDGRGVVVAVWESLENLSSRSALHDWDIFVARSTDGGATWSKAAAIANYAAVDVGADNNPVVATDGRGNWGAAWQSLGTPGGRLGPDSDILFVRSTDNAKTWSRAAALAFYAPWDCGQDFNPVLLALAGGTWIAAWETSEEIAGKGADFDIVYSRSTDAGATWSRPLPLNLNATSDRDTDRQVVLATDGNGVVLAAWEAFAAVDGKLGADWDILLARSEDAGATWSEPVPLASTAATDGFAGDHSVSLATDRSGRWIAVWASSATARQGGRENDWDILRVISTDGGKTWTEPALLNDSLANDVERDLTPRIVYDGNGRWVAVWYSKDDQGGTIGSDGDILVSTSTDGGEKWSLSAPLVQYARDDGSSCDDRPFALSVADGSVLVAWSSDYNLGGKTGNDADIRLVRSVDAPAPVVVPTQLPTPKASSVAAPKK